MQEQFKVDGVTIKAPETYKPVFATTSTSDSDRDQSLVMHNTPIGTIAGYDMTWGVLDDYEIATILNAMLNKSEFSFHHRDPTIPKKWIDRDFYASDYNMDAQSLEDGYEAWEGLSISVRRVTPI